MDAEHIAHLKSLKAKPHRNAYVPDATDDSRFIQIVSRLEPVLAERDADRLIGRVTTVIRADFAGYFYSPGPGEVASQTSQYLRFGIPEDMGRS